LSHPHHRGDSRKRVSTSRRSAQADLKATQLLLTILRDIEGRAEPGAADPDRVTEADQEIIRRIQARLRSEKE
jgi:hypothetical protein